MAVEIDENQHKASAYKTDKEKARYDDLFMDFSGRYIFLRINPDPYKVKSLSGHLVRMDPPFEDRLELAVARLSDLIDGSKIVDPNAPLVKVHHLFFDDEQSSLFFLV